MPLCGGSLFGSVLTTRPNMVPVRALVDHIFVPSTT